MKVFTTIIRILLIVGSLGILIFAPLMIKNIADDTLFQTFKAMTKVSGATLISGMILNCIRALILLSQKK